jgi:6-phosphogluconate dehydrogenase
MVGLGRMGANMTLRLLSGDHEVVVYDVSPDAVKGSAGQGAIASDSLEDLVSKLDAPRGVWIMVPAGEITEKTIDDLSGLLERGDTLIDGGNSRYTETKERAEKLADKGIGFVDSGTSGGIWGLKEGYCLMIGGSDEEFARFEPIFKTLAPEDGYAHVGPVGSGHFVKMVHNGIEYSLLQSYAEGFEILNGGEYELDLPAIAEVWRHGSVIRSWLLDLASLALQNDPKLDGVSAWIDDSGEGRWTLETAIESAIPAPTLAVALFARFASRQKESFAGKLIAALRKEFGGHAIHAADGGASAEAGEPTSEK